MFLFSIEKKINKIEKKHNYIKNVKCVFSIKSIK